MFSMIRNRLGRSPERLGDIRYRVASSYFLGCYAAAKIEPAESEITDSQGDPRISRKFHVAAFGATCAAVHQAELPRRNL